MENRLATYMSGAPGIERVLITVWVFFGGRWVDSIMRLLGKVMEQAGFGRCARPNNTFKIAGLVAFDLGHCVAIACSSYQKRNIDNQVTKVFKAMLEAWKHLLWWPDIRSRQFWVLPVRFINGLWTIGAPMKVTVDIERTFLRVIRATLQCLFSV